MNQKRRKKEWDKPLPAELNDEFYKWQTGLTDLKNVKVPRWLSHNVTNKEEMLIGFADASTKAYGCVVYLRTTNEEGRVTMTIIGAKSKVTPLSKNFVAASKADELTLPRLELLAAEMLAKFMGKIREALKLLDSAKVIAFSDSQITLAWIQGDESKWGQFLANRVRKIKENVPAKQWYYVNTKLAQQI